MQKLGWFGGLEVTQGHRKHCHLIRASVTHTHTTAHTALSIASRGKNANMIINLSLKTCQLYTKFYKKHAYSILSHHLSMLIRNENGICR